MGLFFDGMKCLLCEQPLHSEEQLFGTWGVWLPGSDRLQRYCDAVLHWNCYADWKYRVRFARSYFEFWVRHEQGTPYWWRVYGDETVFVTVNPLPPNASLWVHLAATGCRYPVPVGDWESWLVAEADPTMHPVESNALAYAKRLLRRTLPTGESVFAGIDPNSKSDAVMQQKYDAERKDKIPRQKHDRMLHRNQACADYVVQIARDGLTCPTCGTFSYDYRLSAKDECPSLVICRACEDAVPIPGWS